MPIFLMKVSNVVSRLTEVSQALRETFGTLTIDEINFKPNDAEWSIGQNIDHLIRITESYFPVFDEVLNDNHQVRWFGKFTFTQRVLGNMILQSVQPNRKRKMSTLTIWQPNISDMPETILDDFDESQNKLTEYLEKLSDHYNRRVPIHSPGNDNIIYDLQTAFEIIVNHQWRHLNQAKEVAGLIN